MNYPVTIGVLKFCLHKLKLLLKHYTNHKLWPQIKAGDFGLSKVSVIVSFIFSLNKNYGSCEDISVKQNLCSVYKEVKLCTFYNFSPNVRA